MPRFHRTVPIDDYVLDVLMRDIVGHDQQPAAFLVYLYLSGRAARQHWQPVKSSLRMLADETGLSKSAVQSALATLHFRQLVETSRDDVQRSDFNFQVTLPSSSIPSQATLGGAPRFGRVTQPGFKNRTPPIVSSRGTWV
jgi:DNA-binding transcriptional MocR family regulator